MVPLLFRWPQCVANSVGPDSGFRSAAARPLVTVTRSFFDSQRSYPSKFTGLERGSLGHHHPLPTVAKMGRREPLGVGSPFRRVSDVAPGGGYTIEVPQSPFISGFSGDLRPQMGS